MQMIIVILLTFADLGIGCIMFMVAALVSRKDRPKDYSQAQADLFKAWGDDVIKK